MFESGYYPLGTEHDPNAPWNQKKPKPLNVNCYISCSLSKDVTVTTSDYITEEWEDYDIDTEGNCTHTVEVNYDYSNCNFNEDYHREHYSIPELLKQLEVFLHSAIKDLEKSAPEITAGDKATKKTQLRIYKQMLEDCKGWTLDEEEVGEA